MIGQDTGNDLWRKVACEAVKKRVVFSWLISWSISQTRVQARISKGSWRMVRLHAGAVR